MKVMSQGMIETLKDDELGLQVSEEQMEAITQRADELKKEYERLVRSFKIDFQRQILLELKPQQRATIESLMGDEFQVMGDEAEPALSRTEEVKQAAMETLQRWRTKAEEGEK